MNAPEFSILLYGAITLVLAFCLGATTHAVAGMTLAVVAAGAAYVWQTLCYACLLADEPYPPRWLAALFFIPIGLTILSIVAGFIGV